MVVFDCVTCSPRWFSCGHLSSNGMEASLVYIALHGAHTYDEGKDPSLLYHEESCDLAWISFHSYGALSLNLLFSGSTDSSDLGL